MRRIFAGAAGLIAGALPAQEPPEIVETVEVRVVNVDVVVSDDAGRPVRGLEREDFELRVDGRPVPLEYFSPIVDGLEVGAAEATAGGSAAPYLAIVYDGRGSRPPRVERAVEELSARLDELLRGTRSVMVLRQDTRLVVEQVMTRDRDRLAAALARLAERRTPALDSADRRLLLSQLEAIDPPTVASEIEDELMAQRADDLLRQIRLQADLERFAAEETSRQLRWVIRAMAGLPGRKAILLLGEGLGVRPANALFRIWWSKFRRLAPRIGIFNIESELGRVRADRLLTGLIEEANVHRVSFYSYDPAGLRVFGSVAEYGSLDSNLQIADETERRLDGLVDLALATGGVGRVQAPSLATVLDDMLNGFTSYYSLGFSPGELERGRVRVLLRQPGLKLRYLRRFASRSAARQLEEATLATLLTAAEDNSLEIGVEIGAGERQGDGTVLVPLLVKVPIVRLSLLPSRARHTGRLSFVVVAQGADGGVSSPATGEVPIEIDNDELLTAMGRMAGYRLRLRTSGGEQTVAIGVRDEVAGRDATVRLVLEAPPGA